MPHLNTHEIQEILKYMLYKKCKKVNINVFEACHRKTDLVLERGMGSEERQGDDKAMRGIFPSQTTNAVTDQNVNIGKILAKCIVISVQIQMEKQQHIFLII